MDREEKVRNLPDSPGVYLMKGERGEVLYIGKAKDLRKRVSAYFRKVSRLPGRLQAMVEKVSDIAYIPTRTEAEALIYESSLIKQLSPRYNVELKDDKSYPLLKLTTNEKFPRLFITRRRKKDNSIYYGPYTSAKLLKEALMTLNQVFPLRSCAKMKKKECLNYHIGQCLAPCVGNISEGEYAEIVSELRLFLEGKRPELIERLTARMLEAARKHDFEGASEIKRRIEALTVVREKTLVYGPANELEELKRLLGLKKPPDVIEAFDVSNIMGSSAVGSMIYFHRGRPRKDEYRKFRIKTVERIDDYAMMREIVSRRYARLAEEKRTLPDLILIDGGKGHLNAALAELQRLGLGQIPAIGIAKEFEHIYIKGRDEPMVLPKESKALHLLQRIRDEAHRFAIAYHKNLLSKGVRFSELDNIRGIGPKRRRALLAHFGSVDGISRAGIEDLMKVEGMNEESARAIIGYFKR